MPTEIVESVSVTPVPSSYQKELGKNAYADNRGTQWLEWVVRAKSTSGAEGITIANRFMRQGTVANLLEYLNGALLGREVDSLLEISSGVVTGAGPGMGRWYRGNGWLSILAFDLVGKVHNTSAIDLLGGRKHDSVPAYDTTLYFQDFLVPERGALQVADEAAAAVADGWRELKIKTGRGGRWMMPEAGMRRDIDVVLGVRDAVGPDVKIYVDANFGYDNHLDLLDRFIAEVTPADIFWFEEMITHDVDGYRAMREMQAKHGSKALLTCGEVDRTPISDVFQDLIDEGLIDGYQPDVVGHGFLGWMEIKRQLNGTGVRSIPHNFGNGSFGTYASIVFGAASETYVSLEDERILPHFMTAQPAFSNGAYALPTGPGLGVDIDETGFAPHAKHEFKVEA
ncbi:MAG: enolase C-terminal domain-like protein [Dehalococcoidia bacterium]|jgi:L-alanine-DL-glutamate epimerase-like enolase superfamily enzyme|nr:enolase C-terminal domain-like protein [Dehalococcoidia bacterium]